MRAILVALLLLAACDRRSTPGSDTASPDLGLSYVDRVVRACVIANSCSVPVERSFVGANGTNGCLVAFEQRLPLIQADVPWLWVDAELVERLLACADKHHGDNCAGFHACFGGTWVWPWVFRRDAFCQGSRIVHRADPALYLDCASLGATCVTTPSHPLDPPVTACARKTCATACTSSTTGTVCKDGVSVKLDCAPLGLVCSGNLVRPCKGTAPCPDTMPNSTCRDPAVAQYCDNGTLLTYACGKNPFATACYYKATPPCWPAGRQCGGGCLVDEGSCEPSYDSTCVGDRLVVCVDGFEHEVDCKSLGFAGCTVQHRDAAAGDWVGCSN
jgi:hypothetical protein